MVSHFFMKNKVVNFGALLSLAGLFVMVSTLQSPVRVSVDGAIMRYVESIQTQGGLIVMKVLTDMFSPEIIVALTAVLVCLCLYKKYYYKAVLFTLVTAAGGLSLWWLKSTLQDARPETFFIEESFSFPSGHSAMVVIFFLLVGYFFVVPIQSSVIRRSIVIACGLVVLAVGLSRVYLEMHWLSDVVGGYLLGIFWVSTGLVVVKNNFIFIKK